MTDGHLQIAVDGSLSSDSFRAGRMSAAAESGQNPPPAVQKRRLFVTLLSVATLQGQSRTLTRSRTTPTGIGNPHCKVAYLSVGARATIYEDLRGKMVAAAQALGREIIVLEADSPRDIEAVFVAIVEQQAGALIVGPFTSLATPVNRQKIIELAARYGIPAMYLNRQYVAFGGLMSYAGASRDAFRQLGAEYVAPILRGAK